MKSVTTGTRGAAGGTVPDLDLGVGRYRVRFARTAEDLDRVFALRFQVFNVELGEGLEQSYATRRDHDEFDAHCDHLMVTEQRSGEVIGTYRLQTCAAAETGAGFYSATEFDLDSLPRAVLIDSIELGRACIARQHRSSRVLFLLWAGLARYASWNAKHYLFGCCSLTSQDTEQGARALAFLEREGHLHPEFFIHAQPGYQCQAPDQVEVGEFALPKLFGTYLRYGAKVCSEPAIDRFFGTIDFLALVDVRDVDLHTFLQLVAASKAT